MPAANSAATLCRIPAVRPEPNPTGSTSSISSLTNEELRKLLGSGCSDAALLYLYRKAGLPRETALDALHFTVPRMVAATECLKQLGLWQEAQQRAVAPAPPAYTEDDVRRRLHDDEFSKLIGETQRRLGFRNAEIQTFHATVH